VQYQKRVKQRRTWPSEKARADACHTGSFFAGSLAEGQRTGTNAAGKAIAASPQAAVAAADDDEEEEEEDVWPEASENIAKNCPVAPAAGGGGACSGRPGKSSVTAASMVAARSWTAAPTRTRSRRSSTRW